MDDLKHQMLKRFVATVDVKKWKQERQMVIVFGNNSCHNHKQQREMLSIFALAA